AGRAPVPAVLDSVLGELAKATMSKGRGRKGGESDFGAEAWVAVGSRPIDGVGPLPGVYAQLVDATRAALRLVLRGGIADPEQLALERLLLADRRLADATIRRE